METYKKYAVILEVRNESFQKSVISENFFDSLRDAYTNSITLIKSQLSEEELLQDDTLTTIKIIEGIYATIELSILKKGSFDVCLRKKFLDSSLVDKLLKEGTN